MDFDKALEAAVFGSQKVRVWIECGGARAKLATFDTTHDGEPVAILPYRSGAHLTMHQSGEMDASDGHGHREKASWVPRESEVRRALEPFLVKLRPDIQLVTLDIDTTSWLRATPGRIVFSLDGVIDSLSTMTAHLVTPRLIEEHGLELGPWYFAPETGELVFLLDADGEAFALPTEEEARAAIRHNWPVIGPATRLLDDLVDRGEDLVASGTTREPKATKDLQAVRDALEAKISTIDFSGFRFKDHVRGKNHSLNPDGSTDVRNL